MIRILVALAVSLICVAPAPAQELGQDLLVGTKVAEPFAMKDADGNWHGITIELWESIAAEQGWTFTYREMPLPDLIDGVAAGSVDLGLSAITATAEREARVDFAHSYYSTGLGIAVPAQPPGGLVLFRQLLSVEFISSVALLTLVLLGVGFIIWLLERKRNADHFGGSALQGIGSGFWWSAVTMTTVGYGDKAPATFWGRGLGFVWMFAGIIMISTFTAAITSSLTVSNLRSDIKSVEDLGDSRVGTVAESAPAVSLRDRNVSPRTYAGLEEALSQLKDGNLDAVVYDAPILRYYVRSQFQGDIRVLPQVFERQDYAICLPPGSTLKESLNRAVLGELRSRRWQSLLDRYLGS